MKASSAYAFASIEKDIERPRRVEAYWEDPNLFTLKVHGDGAEECVVVCFDAEMAAAVARAITGTNEKDAFDLLERKRAAP